MISEELEIIQSLRPADIYDPAHLDGLKRAAFNLIDYSDRPGAAAAARVLDGLLRGVEPREEADMRAYHIARYWLLRLKVFAFSNLALSEQVRFVREDAGAVLNFGFPIGEEVERCLDLYSLEKARELARAYASALQQNKTTLGQRDAKRTLGEWLSDYQKSLGARRGPVFEPGAMDLLNFINTSPATKILNPDEKDLLQRLVSLYNSLLAFRPFSKAPTAINSRPTVANLPSRYPVFPPQGTVTREPEARAPVARPQPVIPIRTIPPVELRDRSTEGHRVLPPPPRPKFVPRPVAPTFGSKTGGGQQGAAGQKSAVDEDLYRSTLEELQKMRMDYEKAPSRPISGMPSRKISVPAVPPPDIPVSIKPPAQVHPSADLFQPFSVNEAVARGAPDFQQAGQSQTGLTPGKIIEEKLKKLKNETL